MPPLSSFSGCLSIIISASEIAGRRSVVQEDDVFGDRDNVAVAGTENRWLAIHTPGQAGTFRIELAAAGQAAGRAPCAILQVRAPPAEKDNLSADRAFLERLAGESGGGIIAEKELAKTVAQFETVPETGDVSKAIWTPLWDRWWVLCAMLGFFGVEWFVRRRNGLM